MFSLKYSKQIPNFLDNFEKPKAKGNQNSQEEEQKMQLSIENKRQTMINKILHSKLLSIIMLSVNFFCNISSYDILAYITKNYIALIYYAKIVHLLCQFHAGKVGFAAVCQAIYS